MSEYDWMYAASGSSVKSIIAFYFLTRIVSMYASLNSIKKGIATLSMNF
jgi:hypothetical protein